MDFREFAAQETSVLIERLTSAAAAQSEDVRQHVHDDAQKSIDALRDELKIQITEKEALRTKLEATEVSRDDAQKGIDALRDELRVQITEKEALRTKLEATETSRHDAQKSIDALRDELKVHVTEKDALRAELKGHVTEKDALCAKLESAEAFREQETRAKAAAEGEVNKLDATLQASIANESALRQQLTHTERALEAVRTEAAATAQAAALREQMTRAAPQPIDRLLGIFDQLAKATTVGDVLTALVHGLATEFSRVAAFSVGCNHLEGLQEVGFDFKSDSSKVVVPRTMDSLLTQAATSGRVQGFVGHELTESSCAPFGGSPAFVLTLPISVRGETLAVIYAATDQQPSGGAVQRGVKFGELLLWHATPRLMKVSQEKESTTELRKYATLLLSEIKGIYDADTSDGMEAEDIKNRLRDNLDCAQRLYAHRVTSAGALANPALEEQLIVLIDANAGAPFGQDLAGLVRPEHAPRKGARRRTAEAS